MSDAPPIEVLGVTKRFGDLTAVEDLRCSVPAGSVTGFLGPNGAGKTTTMRVILGLARPTDGEARIHGLPYARLPRPLTVVGASLEATGFHPGRTARRHLQVVATQAGLERDRPATVLEMTGMEAYADRRVGTYSLGMKQRLALATAMLGAPRILVLDEPANGLDPAGVAWLRGFLRRFADEGGAVLISSHILSEVAEVADRVVVIDRGKLVTEGPVDMIRAAAGETVVVRSPDPEGLRAALHGAGADLRTGADPSVLVVLDLPIERVGEVAAAAGIVLHELRRETSSLEDAFLRLTGDGA
ncbi:MAG TPA: ATP-binding cassette domain-containing protein [Actinomycetota bacterium]